MNNIKTIILSTLLIIFLFPNLCLKAQTPVLEFRSNSWLQTWLLCGPFKLDQLPESISEVDHLPGFENDFLKQIGGESNPDIRKGHTVTSGDQSYTWFEYTSPDSIINLDAAVSKQDNVIAYAYCEIEAAKDQVCLLTIGSNDGGRAWLNNEQIWDRPEGRGIVPDDDRIPVLIKMGRNHLLLKIEERGNIWGFCARFLSFDAESFIKNTPLFSVVPHKDGSASLRFLQTESVIDRLFKNANLAITHKRNVKKILWQKRWPMQKEIQLYPENQEYGSYRLQIDATLADEKKWTIAIPFSMGIRTDFILFDNGKSDYAIIIGDDASESEEWAAKELQYWLNKVSGAQLPIRSDEGKIDSKEIVVGFNKHSRSLLGSKATGYLDQDESFSYRNVSSNILIWGGKLRGTMYGVMTFLERELGCRWYTPKVSVAPLKERYSFDYLYHSESPGIRVRNDFYYEAFEPIWAARNKVNGAMNFSEQPREQPGAVEGYWAVHTFNRFMPPSEYFDQHPEYYSLIDGKRIKENTQLCLTNPDVFTIVTEKLKQTIKKYPQDLIYSVSQNDWRNPCQCDKCQEIALREESESGPIIWFVNKVAKNLEKEYPDKFVGTLAYSYTRKPPKNIHPRDNVVIRLCSIECCFAHDFNSCPENASFISDLKGWAAIAPHLYIWDYVVNFSHYIMPYPNFRVLQSNIKTFRDNKAIGIMEQAAYQSRGGEFAELRAYLISKLLWNPECDSEQVINDFMCGYYGRSGQYVREYFDLLHNQLTPETHIHLGLRPDDKLFSDDFVNQADAIFDMAEKVADSEEIRERVEVARLPIMYLKCKRSPMLAKYDGTYDRFTQIVERENITHYAERGAPHREGFHTMVESAK